MQFFSLRALFADHRNDLEHMNDDAQHAAREAIAALAKRIGPE
jgi:hypothetical protein